MTTYAQLEAAAKRLSKQGFKLKLEETATGWAWTWGKGGVELMSGDTTARSKPVALVFALQSAPVFYHEA